MSRKPSVAGNRAAPSAVHSTNGSADDICPICKTIRYLNKDMVFLINPECYHPMCGNCVARLFTGPNQCPYAGCHKTLRRKDFRQAFFDDLTVEREVDLRRRVASVFNRVEDDFDSLDAYNDYLEKVETLTMDLVSGNPPARAAAEDTLRGYEADHRAEIERNRRKGERADEVARVRATVEREAARTRRAEAAAQDDEERRRREREREADLDSLAAAPEGMAGRVLLKRRGQHAREDLLAHDDAALRRASVGGGRGGSGLSIRGLREKKKYVEGPYDPYMGLDLGPSRYVLHGDYPNPWLQAAKEKESNTVGGYSVPEYCARAMFEAFAGLGVFIDDEKETGLGTTAASVATVGAAIASEQSRPHPPTHPPAATTITSIKTEVTVKMEVDSVF